MHQIQQEANDEKTVVDFMLHIFMS
jgi:hypothetical protein